MRKQAFLLLPLLALIGVGIGLWQAGLFGGGKSYNVLLISIDSLRADRLGLYGHRAEYVDTPVSPNLDSLAAEGVAFDNAWSTTSWTLPAHMAMLTGLTDGSHGVIQDDFRLDPLRQTLAAQFQQAGYQTAGYFSGPYLDPRHGFDRGFEEYRSGMMSNQEVDQHLKRLQAYRAQNNLPGLDKAQVQAFLDRKSHWDITSPRINRHGLGFLERNGGKEPFFLFLHYFDVHYDHIPETAEEGLEKAFDPEYRGNFPAENWYFSEQVRDAKGRRLIGERDLHHILANYDAEIHWVDRHIGQILDKLKEMELYENTIICITSDHGDEFFDRGSIGHRSHLHHELLKIPLVLRVPDGLTPPGKRIAELAKIYDIGPTLLDYAGVDPLPHAEGRSLRSLIDDQEGSELGAFCRILSPVNIRGDIDITDGWRDERYTVIRKLIPDRQRLRREGKVYLDPKLSVQRQPIYLVYDRVQDPKELQPLKPEDPRYRQAVEAFCRDYQLAERDRALLPQSPLQNRYAPQYSEDAKAAFDSLGYVTVEEEGQRRHPPVAPLPAPCETP
ncbi:MAG: hypothetical protein DWQ01_08175 [Planctomycetota bacterium]|nr:MAG: hypothetical protein DWQ01_08175 [Planctomycetota bacterium]